MMATITNIDANGDLVIGLGEGPTRQLLKVNTVILQQRSQVFGAMLGPCFKEGKSSHDESNPLELPEDDPGAMANLFLAMHSKYNQMVKKRGWLPAFALVYDKYQCDDKLKTFLQNSLDFEDIPGKEKMLIHAVLGNEAEFSRLSNGFVTTPRKALLSMLHPNALSLLPADTLDILEDYRRRTRTAYAIAAQIPIGALMKKSSAAPCSGLQARLTRYITKLYTFRVVLDDIEEDTHLLNMYAGIWASYFDLSGDQYDTDIDNVCKKQNTVCYCKWRFKDAVAEMLERLVPGRGDNYKLCYPCWRLGSCIVLHECTIHVSKEKQQARRLRTLTDALMKSLTISSSGDTSRA